MLPAVNDRFAPLFILAVWYSQSSGRSKTLAAMTCTSGAADGSKMRYTLPADRDVYSNAGWIPSSNKHVEAVSVYLSYELYSLLWRYLRASDQQFPGRHGELSDWSERLRDGALFPSSGIVLSQRAPRGRRPFVKRPVTSSAFTVHPARALCIDLTGSLSPFF